MERLVARCLRLTSLSLKGIENVRPNLLRAPCCATLTSLDVRIRQAGSNDIWLRKIGDCCRSLTSLRLGAPAPYRISKAQVRCSVTDTGLSYLSQCPLAYLELWHCGSAVSRAGVLHLVKNCPRLTGLHLINCSSVSDSTTIDRSASFLCSVYTADHERRVSSFVGRKSSTVRCQQPRTAVLVLLVPPGVLRCCVVHNAYQDV